MRHWVILVLFLFSLGTLRLVACGEDDRSCVDDEDCDDGNPCTLDWCYSFDPNAPTTCEVVRRCSHSTLDDGTTCGSDQVCVEGVCTEDIWCAGVCDDGNECTWNICDLASGDCQRDPRDDETPCDSDGRSGICISGVCVENLCEDVVCDDENQCTEDTCDYVNGGCRYEPQDDETPCDFDGRSGICISGVCVENLCEDVVCDDENQCTEDTCSFEDGFCEYTPIDGTPCEGGFCRDGACEPLVDQCTADDLAAIEAGGAPDLEMIANCAAKALGSDFPACINRIARCLQDAGTTLTPECSSCFGLLGCCGMNLCGPPAGGPCVPQDTGDACNLCLQERCYPEVDACIGE